MLHSAFQFANCPPVVPTQLRLTRLNIYSGLYLQWAEARIVIDPAKLVPDLIWQLAPDLILVSHESMDHFDPEVCLHWLERSGTALVGSWGTIAAFAGLLPSEDDRWTRIYSAVPGATFVFGDITLKVHASLHCEYASPVFFEIVESSTGWRLIDLVDTATTQDMRAGKLIEGCDLLIVPLGIALGTSADSAWEQVELLNPRSIMPGHFNGDPSKFVAKAESKYTPDRIHICRWHEGITLLHAGNPVISTIPKMIKDNPWAIALRTANEPAQALEIGLDDAKFVDALYALTWTTVLYGPTVLSEERLLQLNAHCLDKASETISAAYLLALGVTFAKSTVSYVPMLELLLRILDPARPYLSYWLLECCGRAAENSSNLGAVSRALERIASDEKLFASEPIRRKYMWEVFRLVQFGYRGPGLNTILWKTFSDPNQDVRLLAFKTLPFCAGEVLRWRDLLAQGSNDPHEDVLEWVVNAYVDLLPCFHPDDFSVLNEQLPKFLTHSNYHVRLRSNVLAEMALEVRHGRATRA